MPGSVLLRDGQVWLVAGRTSYLDGGLYLHRLDLAGGKCLATTRVDQRDPKIAAHPAGIFWGFNMPGAQNDVLSSDGQHVFMRHAVFGPDGGQAAHLRPAPVQSRRVSWTTPGGTAPSGSSGPGWSRAPATGAWRPNQVPYGELLCLGRDVACGFGRTSANKQASHVGVEDTRYQLFAVAAEPKDRQAWAEAQEGKSAIRYRWRRNIPLLGRAMLLAGKTLWVAGPPDLVRQNDAEASAALAGSQGGLLWAVAVADGQTLAEYKLDAPPVFDGMAASRRAIVRRPARRPRPLPERSELTYSSRSAVMSFLPCGQAALFCQLQRSRLEVRPSGCCISPASADVRRWEIFSRSSLAKASSIGPVRSESFFVPGTTSSQRIRCTPNGERTGGLISPAFSSKAARENDSSIGPWRPILPSRPPCLRLGPAEYFSAAAAKSILPDAISARIDSARFSKASISSGRRRRRGEEGCG